MSNDEQTSSGSVSQSTSDSSNSSGHMSFFYDSLNDGTSNIDLTLYGSPAPTLVRTGTVVRRANSVPSRKDIMVESNSSNEEDDATHVKEVLYRHSLASISEKRSAMSSLSKSSGRTTSRTPFSSMETSSDADCALRSTSESYKNFSKTVLSPTSTNYLTWIESVNTEYSGSAISNLQDSQEPDNKVGEWNNFWLNYSNARLRHLSERTFSSNFNDIIVIDGMSDEVKSRGSTPRDGSRSFSDRVMLTLDEVNETIRCSKRITEIMENATKRSQMDSDSNESYYSQAMSGKDSIKDDVILPAINISVNRERSTSWVVDSHGQTTVQKSRSPSLQKNEHSSSTSCINALLNTGNDILKRVIAKKHQGTNTPPSKSPSRSLTGRNSFSDWGMK